VRRFSEGPVYRKPNKKLEVELEMWLKWWSCLASTEPLVQTPVLEEKKSSNSNMSTVAQACNPSHLGGQIRDQRSEGSQVQFGKKVCNTPSQPSLMVACTCHPSSTGKDK
jgi:hypothetical protein